MDLVLVLSLFACLSLSVISVVTGLALVALVTVADALSYDSSVVTWLPQDVVERG